MQSYFWPWDQPFYGGATVAEILGSGYHIAIGGRPYVVDPEQCERQFVKQLRSSFQDSSTQPGEHYLNPETAMRVSTGDFSHGAGQTYLDDVGGTDDPGSDRRRFFDSRGMYVWEARCLSLLPATHISYPAASSTSTLRLVSGLAAASGVYVLDDDGTTHRVARSVNPNATTPTWTNCTGLPAGGPVSAISTDGINVFVVAGAGAAAQVYAVTMPGTAFTALTTGGKTYIGCAYANGRLFSWTSDGEMWEITKTGAPDSVMLHRADTRFVWRAVAGAPNATYLCGTLGQSTEIYRVDVSDASGTLGAAIPALTIYDEAVRAAAFDSGKLVLGLAVEGGTKGDVRCCDVTPQGGLILGPQTVVGHTPRPVTWIDPAGRFVYFPWSDYDADHTGLGRLDLTSSTDSELVYAYASDLMAGRDGVSIQGMVRGSAAYDGTRVFSVDGRGVYAENDPAGGYDMVGVLHTGRMRFGMFDPKAFTSVEVAWDPLPMDCSITVDATFEDGSSVNLFVNEIDDSTGSGGRVSLPHDTHQWIELTITIKAPAGVSRMSPCFRWFVIRAVPATGSVERIVMAVRLHVSEESSASESESTDLDFDVDFELDFLRELAGSGRVVALQRGNRSEDVYLKDVAYKPDRWSWDQRTLEGMAFVEMHTLE